MIVAERLHPLHVNPLPDHAMIAANGKRIGTLSASISDRHRASFETLGRFAGLLPKPRLDLLAQQPQRVHHPGVRDEAAAVQFGEDAVKADAVLQSL